MPGVTTTQIIQKNLEAEVLEWRVGWLNRYSEFQAKLFSSLKLKGRRCR
jgi:hypothetical protein